MSITTQQLIDTFPQLFQVLKGSTNITFDDISGADNMKPNTAVFINESKYLDRALKSEVSVIILGSRIKAKFESLNEQPKNKVILTTPIPTYAMALTIQKFFMPIREVQEAGVHSSAIIHPTAKISKNVKIGPLCVVGARTTIAEGSVLQSNITLEEDISIGQDCTIMANVFIGYKTQIGDRVEIQAGAILGTEGFGFAPNAEGKFTRIPQRGIVVLENDVSIGASTCIDRATFDETRICEGTKLDNNIHVGHNCRIGKHGVLSGGSVLAGSSILGNHVMLGGLSAVGGHLTIGDKVQIGGMSGFSQDIPKPGAYAGRPLQPLKDYLRSQILLTRIGSMFKDLQKVKKHLGIKSDNTEESEQ